MVTHKNKTVPFRTARRIYARKPQPIGYSLPATFNIRIGIHHDSQSVSTRDLRFGPDSFQKRINTVRSFNLELRHGSMAFAYVFDNMIICTAFHQ